MTCAWTGGYAAPCEECGLPLLTDEETRGVCDDCVHAADASVRRTDERDVPAATLAEWDEIVP